MSNAPASPSHGRHPDRWVGLAAVFSGGLIGSAARSGIGMWGASQVEGFPTEILLVNLLGSFLLGLYLARRERAVTGRGSVQFWAIGVFGSFTTFSAFSADTVTMLDQGRFVATVVYVAASLLGGLALALAGRRIGEVVL